MSEALRDKPGPQHQPLVREIPEISGVVIESSPFVKYDGDNILTDHTENNRLR